MNKQAQPILPLSPAGISRHILLPGALVLALSAALNTAATAVTDNWNVEGEHGELHVFGALTEGACRLAMTSELQQVNLGEIPASELRHQGDRGQPIAFKLKLRDCVRTGGSITDHQTGHVTWDPLQPVVDVTFVAPNDADSPQLVQVWGVTGLGLRLTDSQHRDIHLGERSMPQFVTPHNDELVYYVQPERTSAALTPGVYWAAVDFRLSYD